MDIIGNGEEVLFCSVFRVLNQTINSENSEHGQIQIALGDCFKTCLIEGNKK